MTSWGPLIACFFGGVFLANALPHLASGVMGRPFQTPFAKPPGEGLSSATVNVVWGVFNLAVSYLLTLRVAAFDPGAMSEAGAMLLGVLAMGLFCARHFGRFHGGNPARS